MPSIDDIYGTAYEAPRPVRKPEVVIPPPVRISALVRFQGDTGTALKADALAVLSIKVKPVETVEAASELANKRAQVKVLLKNIEARRKQIVEPLKREAGEVDAEARTWADPLKTWDQNAERVLLAWEKRDADVGRMAQEARHKAMTKLAEEQAAAEAAGDLEAVQKASSAIMTVEATPEAQPVTGFKTDAGTTYKTKRWKIEVINPAEVPPAYLVPDLKRLQAAVDAHPNPAQLHIEGCHIEEVEKLPVRTR